MSNLTNIIDAQLITYNNSISSGLYVGASSVVSPANKYWFESNHINGVLNVAFDVDDSTFNNSDLQYISSILFCKVGLVDTGPSPGFNTVNQLQTLIAAVYVLDQLKTRSGSQWNVLVHCVSGGSRSVAVAALWMAQRLPIELVPNQTRFETALNFVRKSRGLGSQPYDPTNPNARPDGGFYDDGKPMASHFYAAQAIDQSMALFPSMTTLPPTGWPNNLSSLVHCP